MSTKTFAARRAQRDPAPLPEEPVPGRYLDDFFFFQRTELVVSDGSVEMRTIRRREVATTATTKFSSFFHYFGAATAFFGRTFSSAVSRFDPVIRDNPLDGCFPLRLPKWMLISLRQLTKDAANTKC